MSIPSIKHFGKNTLGRDFVVGDLHGCFHMLQESLVERNFDPVAGDRLFSVGDLVDRGPHSKLCLEWLGLPYFHSVRGNHEQMAIDATHGFYDYRNYFANGGAWFLDMPQHKRNIYADQFEFLPIAIEIETENGLVGIVHANCPTDQWMDMHDGLRGQNAESFAMMCMWDRSRYNSGRTDIIGGVDKVIVGHTPVQESQIRGNVHYIDTGAVFGKRLTIIQL